MSVPSRPPPSQAIDIPTRPGLSRVTLQDSITPSSPHSGLSASQMAERVHQYSQSKIEEYPQARSLPVSQLRSTPTLDLKPETGSLTSRRWDSVGDGRKISNTFTATVRNLSDLGEQGSYKIESKLLELQ